MGIKVQENVILAPYTTYKIGGPARYFCEAKSEEEIIEAVSWARKEGIPYFILGGGSNILISDKGFGGVVVKIENCKLSPCGGSPVGGKTKNLTIEAGAGLDLPQLVAAVIARGLKGLEWASGIPGTFGGAIRGNAGAFGGEIKDILISVRFLDAKGNIRVFDNKECNFSYRDSIFKQNPDYIILSAVLAFERGDKEALREFSEKTIAYRASRHPLEYGSCGSVFKALDVNLIPPKIFTSYPRFGESIKNDPFPVVPAACFIDEVGLKGYSIGGAMISTKHPNFFVNFKDARSKDVVKLIKLAKTRLFDKFGIMLDEEVEYVGFEF